MVVLLREHPEWLCALVEVIAKQTLPERLVPIDSAVRVVDPAKVRLDLALASTDTQSRVLVEVQLDEDKAKAASGRSPSPPSGTSGACPETFSSSPPTARSPLGRGRSGG